MRVLHNQFNKRYYFLRKQSVSAACYIKARSAKQVILIKMRKHQIRDTLLRKHCTPSQSAQYRLYNLYPSHGSTGRPRTSKHSHVGFINFKYAARLLHLQCLSCCATYDILLSVASRLHRISAQRHTLYVAACFEYQPIVSRP